MNKSIRFGATFSLILIVALLVNLSIIQTFKEEEYAQDERNSRLTLELRQINRGQIIAGNEVLAESFKNDSDIYQRSYPRMPFSFAPVLGYVSNTYGTSQLEAGFNAELMGETGSGASRFLRTGRESDRKGNTVELTIDPQLQALAYDQLSDRGYSGAVSYTHLTLPTIYSV